MEGLEVVVREVKSAREAQRISRVLNGAMGREGLLLEVNAPEISLS
jgi:hypothetical protein